MTTRAMTIAEGADALLDGAGATLAGVLAWRRELVWRLAQEVRTKGSADVSEEILTKITMATLWLEKHEGEKT